MYRMGIWLIALALIFNGATAYALNDFSSAPMPIAQNHHDTADAVNCNIHSNDVAAIVKYAGPPHGFMHFHQKCCATCTLVSVLPDGASVPVPFAHRAAMFHAVQHGLVGHPAALDPDIPKSMV